MPLTPQPAVPATTVALANPFGQWCSVAVAGGTVTNVSVNGSTVAAGTGVSVAVPPGGTIAITYSVAPSWTWSNFPALGYGPGYAAENTGLVNTEGNLPWTAHGEAGETGLGIGVSN